jgi:predicted nucleic acid-binding protein
VTARYLLDVSALIALLWDSHEHNERATRWQESAGALAVCPISEIGFLRISTQPIFGATVEQARKMLRDWKAAKRPKFIPCDIEALETVAPGAGTRTTDFYLAGLAKKHGLKLATLENNMGHPAAFSIPA